jgi:pyrroline-5-carboxylate reductase
VIGGGKMGEAIVRGWLAADAVEASRIVVVEPSDARRRQLEDLPGVRTTPSARQALPVDLVLLAVKPQIIERVVTEIAPMLADSLVVSIAAGISCARLESLMPSGTAVVRVMPNTPALVREGMAVVSGGEEASSDNVELVRALFGTVGSAIIIEERHQDAATAISGSGPAYFALVIDALARGGVGAGLTREVSQMLAVQTMKGTAAMLAQTGMHPEELVDGVSSPGGTTIAAVNALESAGLRAAFADAVRAAVARSEELGQGV